MAGNREEQLTHVIQHHMSSSDAQVSVHQVQNTGTKRHQIIIDIKQDIDMDEMSTRSLAESVMETLGARSAAVYIDNSQITGENSDLESLTTVNVIVANDLSQTATQIEEETSEPAESGPRVERVVEMNTTTASETATATSISISTATTTASGMCSRGGWMYQNIGHLGMLSD